MKNANSNSNYGSFKIANSNYFEILQLPITATDTTTKKPS